MSRFLCRCCAPGGYRRVAHFPLVIWSTATLVVFLRTEGLQAQPATQLGGGIANTAQAVAETPADTVIVHRESARRARGGNAGEREVLPARSGGPGKSLWFGDGWYVTGLISLTAVLGLIFLLTYLARRFVLPGAGLGSRELAVLARTYVGNKQSIALVRAGRRLMVVGATANQVSLLMSLDDPEEEAELLARLAAGKPGSIASQFGKRLEEASEPFEEAEPGELPYQDERPEFVLRTRRQLRTAIKRMRGFGREAAARRAGPPDGQNRPRQRVTG